MKRIILKNVSKKVKIGSSKDLNPLLKLFYSISGKEHVQDLEIIGNVSLSIDAGKRVGIIGKNGAGKSSLLRAIAQIYNIDTGSVEINGKLISLINLELHGRLTMRDNIYLCCTLYGLDERTIKEKFNSIVEFSQLKDFVDTKIYQFSTGMVLRVVTSVVVHCNPDILLIDDADAVTDKDFTSKYVKKGIELTKNGTTILIVSHNLKVLGECDEVIWVEKGEIKKFGNSREVIEEYKQSS